MKKVKLGEVCKVLSGSTPKREKAEYWGGAIPWVTPKEISRLASPYLWDSVEKITEKGFRSCSTAMLPAGSLLLSSRAPIGLLAINKVPVCTNQGFKSLIPSQEIDVEYLYYYLKKNVNSLQAKGNGATFKELSKPTVEDFQIVLPPLDDQKRIAHLLGKVEGLIAQRKQHLQQLDDLLKSVFLEMFGDPVRNERGWDKPELKNFGKISTGNTPPRNDPENYEDDFIEWIKTDNIISDAVFVTASAEHLSKTGSQRGRIITNGALLVACIAGSVESIGRAALTNRTVAFNQQINAIQSAEDVNPFYLYGLFKLSRAYIQSHATKGMKKILTKGDFERIPMIKPPVELQNQFATIAEKIESLKYRYQQSLTDLENLYGALSQQAFKGELNLSLVDPIAQPLQQHHSNSDIHQVLNNDLGVKHEKTLLLATLEGRIKLLRQMFLKAINDLSPEDNFDLDYFWVNVLSESIEFIDENSELFGVAEYEQLKKWIFEMLESGKLEQRYDEIFELMLYMPSK